MTVLKKVTQTVQALPVMQERKQMGPERVKEQRNSVLTSLLAFAVGAAIIAWTPWPWWAGGIAIAYGLVTFDPRAAWDFLKFLKQLGQLVTSFRKKETPDGEVGS